MTQFMMFRDQVGAELYPARTTRKEVVGACGNRVVRFVPVELRPVEVIDRKSVAGRVAGGYLLAGPVGSALGVLTAKGPTVRFEMRAADGTTHIGAIEQDRYPALRRSVEKIALYRPGDGLRTLGMWLLFPVLLLLFLAMFGPVGMLVAVAVQYAIAHLRQRRRIAALERAA